MLATNSSKRNAKSVRGVAVLPHRMSVATYREMVAQTKTYGRRGRGARKPLSCLPADDNAQAAAPIRPHSGLEEELHRECFKLVSALTPRYPVLAYLMHVPNGGARSRGEAGKLKAMGTRPGVPDFLLPRSNGVWRGLAVELKSPTGRLSQEQQAWLTGLSHERYLVGVCRSVDSFQSLLMTFLEGM